MLFWEINKFLPNVAPPLAGDSISEELMGAGGRQENEFEFIAKCCRLLTSHEQ
jgi:hypothetical protein